MKQMAKQGKQVTEKKEAKGKREEITTDKLQLEKIKDISA